MQKIYVIFTFSIIMNMTGCQSGDYTNMLESLYSHTVPIINSQDLVSDLNDKSSTILLDTRSNEEFQVSHIKNARMIDYEAFDKNNVEDIAMDAEIVVYCSVGYRSEKIGEKLLEMGFTNVKNLYGGIFQWKNDGFGIVNEKSIPTDSVHTYNKKWSKWLKKGIKVY